MSEYTGKFIDGDGLKLINQLIDEKLKNLGGGSSGSYGKYVDGESVVGSVNGKPLYRYVVHEFRPSEQSTTATMFTVVSFPVNTVERIYRSDVFEKPSSMSHACHGNFMYSDGSYKLFTTFYRNANNDIFFLTASSPYNTCMCVFEYTKK